MKTLIEYYAPILLVCLPAAMFGMSVAYLVVPEVVRVVVPAIVEKVAALQ